MAVPPANKISEKFRTTSGEVLNAKYVKDNYLFGIPLKDYTKKKVLSDKVIRTHIRNSASWLERKAMIRLAPFPVVDERHEYYVNDYQHFAFLKLNNTPVAKVTQVSAQYPNDSTVFDFPEEWINLNGTYGHVRLVPTAGTLDQVLLGQTGNFLPMLQMASTLPMLFRVFYVAGFENGEVPDDILNAVAKKAAIQVLHLIGEHIGGLGLSSASLALDGLSQSVGTTKERGNVFGGRIDKYEEELADEVSSIRQAYKGILMTSV
jgi:hypothetical protein